MKKKTTKTYNTTTEDMAVFFLQMADKCSSCDKLQTDFHWCADLNITCFSYCVQLDQFVLSLNNMAALPSQDVNSFIVHSYL